MQPCLVERCGQHLGLVSKLVRRLCDVVGSLPLVWRLIHGVISAPGLPFALTRPSLGRSSRAKKDEGGCGSPKADATGKVDGDAGAIPWLLGFRSALVHAVPILLSRVADEQACRLKPAWANAAHVLHGGDVNLIESR